MTINNLQTLNGNSNLSYYLIMMWENVLHIEDVKDKYDIAYLPKGLNNTYLANFYGLLKNQFNIPIQYWYPNLRLNGLNNSVDYNGFDEIKIFKSEVLETYYDLIVKDMNLNNK